MWNEWDIERSPFDDEKQWSEDLCSCGIEIPLSREELKEKYCEEFMYFDSDGIEHVLDENNPIHWEMIDRAWETVYRFQREEIEKKEQEKEDWLSKVYWHQESLRRL